MPAGGDAERGRWGDGELDDGDVVEVGGYGAEERGRNGRLD